MMFKDKLAIVITDNILLSEVICKYIEYTLEINDSFYFTYSNSDSLSREIYDKADIFILEVFRIYDNGNVRAEGILVSEKLIESGKKVLLIAPDVNCEEIDSLLYWDISCKENMCDKVKHILETDFSLESLKVELSKIKNFYKEFLIRPSHHG